MKLWQKAAGVLKDKRSIYLAKVARKKGFRNPDLEAAIIKATSHDKSFVDYKNVQRVFNWVRTSPAFLKPLVWALTKRVEKTRNWVVALKTLMLIHGVFSTKIPAVKRIGRLPFDLSSFHDQSSSPAKSWGFSAFIRAYYAFVDQHSTFLSYYHDEKEEKQEEREPSMSRTLLKLNRSQALLDLLLQIKPYANGMEMGLVLEAMDCIVIEVFDVYGRICNGIITVLSGEISATATEGVEALQILQKTISQNSQLLAYFQLCREMGVGNATELPPIQQITEEDICELQWIIRAVSGNEGENEQETKRRQDGEEKEKIDLKKILETNTVRENWVVFNDVLQMDCRGASSSVAGADDLNGF